jgi:hypothetical protein
MRGAGDDATSPSPRNTGPPESPKQALALYKCCRLDLRRQRARQVQDRAITADANKAAVAARGVT